METVKLAVETRDQSGSGPARRLRAKGRVPGVVYGAGEAFPISFDAVALRQVLAHGTHVVLELHYPADPEGRKHLAVIKEMQRKPVGSALLHVDLHEIQLGEEIDAPVTIEVVGVAPGAEAGGVLDQQLREITLHGQPGAMPATMQVDVSDLQMGDHILLGALTPPEGCTIVGDPDQVIVTVLAPRVLAEEPEAAAPEVASTETPAE